MAVLDISQDFLLTHLQDLGVFHELVIFKGGTALRKLFAGARGRFSTDIDLAAREIGADRRQVGALIAQESDVTLGPFHFDVAETRDRWEIRVTSEFGNPIQTIKLEVGPPCWLEPEDRDFVAHPTHSRYGFALPTLPTMRLEEILAEKIARLSRQATARDAFDLVWAATTSPHSQFDRSRVRRLSMLKVWIDNFGMEPGWSPALAPSAFQADQWLSPREWDDEQIGMLAHPAPALPHLERELARLYSWLRELHSDEIRWGGANPRDRSEVIRAIQSSMFSALRTATLY